MGSLFGGDAAFLQVATKDAEGLADSVGNMGVVVEMVTPRCFVSSMVVRV